MDVSANSERNLRKRRQTLALKTYSYYIQRRFLPGVARFKKTYGPLSQKSKLIEKKNKNIDHSKGSMYLLHSTVQPDMKQFVKCSWRNFEQMKFSNCFLTSSDWQILVQNTHLYPHLKLIILSNNQIRHVTIQDLERFKELKYINLTGNNLTEDSFYEIKAYQKKYKGQVKVIIDDFSSVYRL